MMEFAKKHRVLLIINFLLLVWLIGVNIPMQVEGDSRSFPNKNRIYGYNGTNWKEIALDSTTRILETITDSHHEIHEGNHWISNNSVTLNSTARAYVLSVSGTTACPHVLWSINATAAADIGFYSGITASANGTPMTLINNRMDNQATPNMTLFYGPTITNMGAHGYTLTAGNGRKIGGDVRADNELILAKNSKYLIYLIDTSAANNKITVEFEWYEHTDLTP